MLIFDRFSYWKMFTVQKDIKSVFALPMFRVYGLLIVYQSQPVAINKNTMEIRNPPLCVEHQILLL